MAASTPDRLTREAVRQRAQAHVDGCRCVICQAAAGDERALLEVQTFLDQWPDSDPLHRNSA